VAAPLSVEAIAGVPCDIDMLAAVTDVEGEALTVQVYPLLTAVRLAAATPAP
jgi:hypothetical protein